MGEELNNSGITYGPGSASFKFSVKSENDFGFYTCEATNSRGRASPHSIEVYKTSMHTKPLLLERFPIECRKPKPK